MAGVGGNIKGYNVFTYCFNNPVNMVDPSGDWPYWFERWVLNQIIEWAGQELAKAAEAWSEVAVRVSTDLANYDVNNADPEAVFRSNLFSSYNGKLVIKTPFDASFSFGFIGLSIYQQDIDTLNHEYGHTLQMDNMGTKNYIINVAIPSITLNLLSRRDNLTYDYYSYPWEAEANRLGHSAASVPERPKLPEGGYTSYWDLIKLFFN